jgi:hypothetical protein
MIPLGFVILVELTMALSPGSRLGPYEVLAAVGAGGMGEVAIKLLPPRLAGDQPDWTVLPPKTPARVRALLSRCLEKDPHRRLRFEELRSRLAAAGK